MCCVTLVASYIVWHFWDGGLCGTGGVVCLVALLVLWLVCHWECGVLCCTVGVVACVAPLLLLSWDYRPLWGLGQGVGGKEIQFI